MLRARIERTRRDHERIYRRASASLAAAQRKRRRLHDDPLAASVVRPAWAAGARPPRRRSLVRHSLAHAHTRIPGFTPRSACCRLKRRFGRGVGYRHSGSANALDRTDVDDDARAWAIMAATGSGRAELPASGSDQCLRPCASSRAAKPPPGSSSPQSHCRDVMPPPCLEPVAPPQRAFAVTDRLYVSTPRSHALAQSAPWPTCPPASRSPLTRSAYAFVRRYHARLPAS